MSNRTLLFIAVGAFVPLFGMFLLLGLTRSSSDSGRRMTAQPDKVIYVPPHLEPATSFQTINSSPAPVSKPVAFSAPANAPAVHDADLKQLATLVDLAAAKNAAPSVAKWTKALPIAKQLAAGTCDCEQRNWLNQFIAMGDYALSGAPEYHESAKLMDKLPLNDDNLATRYNSN